jgi:hypothetical protein
VHDALPPHLGRGVCAALAAAVQSVLLDGGPYRLFTPQDVDMLEVDMAQVGRCGALTFIAVVQLAG